MGTTVTPEGVGGQLYYGIDGSGSASSGPCALEFYIGELGVGTTIGGGPCNGACFNTDAANAVGSGNTFGYWFVYGPTKDPSYNGTTTEANHWGHEQGRQAVQAWYDNPHVARYTIFADIEGAPNEYGWSTDQSLNVAVWEGFYEEVNGANNGLMKAGVYSAPDAWATLTGSHQLNGSVPEWSSESDIGCSAACPTPTTFDAQGFGGEFPVIWQYAINCGSYGDLDAASSLPS